MDELIVELKSNRERMGLSLQDLFQKTRINVSFLEALEQGNFEILPDAYVKLFLKRYAQEVKLDGDEIVKRFEQLHWKKAATETPVPTRSDGLPRWVFAAAAVLLLGVVGGFFALQGNEDNQISEPVSTRTNTRASTSPTPTVASASPSENTSSSEMAATQSQSVTPAPVPTTADPAVTDPEAATAVSQPNEIVDDVSPGPPQDVPEPAATGSQETASSSVQTDIPAEPASPVAEEVLPRSDPVTPPPLAEITNVEPAQNEPVVSGYSLSLQQDLTAAEGNLKMDVEVIEETRITVISDGEPVFDDLVNGGRRTGWEARDRFMIEIENGAGVLLKLQEENLPRVGASGQKVRLFVSRSSIWVEEIESANVASSESESP